MQVPKIKNNIIFIKLAEGSIEAAFFDDTYLYPRIKKILGFISDGFLFMCFPNKLYENCIAIKFIFYIMW